MIALGQAVVVYGIAALFGGRFRGSLLLGLAILLLSVFAYAGIGFLFGSRLSRRTEDVNGPVAAFGVPLLVLGGTFFPVSILPPSLLAAARLDPVFHMIEAMKGVSADGRSAAEIAPHLLFLIAFAGLSLLLGTRAYRRMVADLA